MQFNTGQVQELAGVRREQLRHWRKVLPPLTGRDGRADQYTFEEVIGLAVIAVIVDGLGVAVSRLTGCAADIFALLEDCDDLNLLPTILHVTHTGDLTTKTPNDGSGYVSVRLPEVIKKVQQRLGPEQRRQLLLPLDQGSDE